MRRGIYFPVKRLGNSGQSTIEFALALILFLAFFLFYFRLCMIFAFGSYVHYATFMSARAFLSAGADPADQKSRARAVIVQTLQRSERQAGMDKFPFIAKGIGGDPGGFKVGPHDKYVEGDINFSWMRGVRYTFRSKLFMIPLAGIGRAGRGASSPNDANTLILTSESWLGQEPSYEDCKTEMNSRNWIFDNGC